jgi:hypothetical protein
MRHGARTGNYDGFFGNDERIGFGGCVNHVANQIVNRDRAIKDRARAKNRATLHHGPFINARIPPDQNLVFDNHRQGTDGFKNTADLRSRRNVTIAANLRAAPHQRVRINHRAFSNIGADVYEHRRHANHSTADVTAIANTRAARNDSNAVRRCERANRVSGLIKEGLLRHIDRHVGDGSHSKPEQNPLLYPGVRAPAGFRGAVGLRGADFAAIQRTLKIAE